jgi:hypothetical protein
VNGPGRRPIPRLWAALGAALLVLLSAGPIWQGRRILHRPAQIRAQLYPRAVPTTGPYTDRELDNAAMDWRQFSGVMRHDIPPDELAPLAESRRRQEDFRQSAWQRRIDKDAAHADSRRPFGYLLIALGGLLILIFTALGLKALLSFDSDATLELRPPSPL